MRILNLGLEPSALDENSKAVIRFLEYARAAGEYVVIVPAGRAETIDLSQNGLKIFGSGGKNKFSRLFRTYSLAKNILTEKKFDVLSVQDQYYLALIGFLLSRKFRIGLEIQIHGWEKFSGVRTLVARFVIPRVSAIRVVSQRLKKHLIREFGVDEQKITAVPIYTELKIDEREKGAGKNKGKIIFLTVARLVSVKNIGLQIEAMSQIVKEHPEAELWIVGDGPERLSLERKIDNLGLGLSVKLFGRQEDIDRFYSEADIYLLSSDSEGWGLSVIEAASWGLPIIMTDVGCAGEFIKNNENGIVVPVGDKESFVAAVSGLIKDEALRKRLGENAKRSIGSLLDKETTMNLYKQSWQKAAGNSL